MSELTVAEEYRTLITQLPLGSDKFIDSAVEKSAELAFLKIIAELEVSLVNTILHSENLTSAMIKIAHINQLNALADEAFRQASILANNHVKKPYHQLMGLQLQNQVCFKGSASLKCVSSLNDIT
jgi:hypothetical protein